MPDSRAPAALLDAAEISVRHITRNAQRLLSGLRLAETGA